MTSTADSPESSMSLDSEFTPPSRQQWVEMAVAGLSSSKADVEALQELQRTTLEGIPMELLYDAASVSFQTTPGSENTQSWDNRLSAQPCNAVDTNKKILQGLAGGITSVELCSYAEDMATALQGVQLNLAKISLRAKKDYQGCTDELVKLALAQGIDHSQLVCSLNADPVHSWLQGTTQSESLSAELEAMARFTKENTDNLPLAKSVLVDVAIHHNAGASTVEELHAALATALLYLETMLDAGMSIDNACQQISFQIAMDSDMLLGVAKIRALKALWQYLVRLVDPDVKTIHPVSIVAETSQRYTTTLEPWNNHLRNLAAGTAAALGGADALMVHPHDALQRGNGNTDTELGDRMARNIAIILERECGLRKVYDPMAGSYAIENLTQALMQHTWQSLGSSDTSEGWLDELTSGRWQKRLSHTHQQRITLMKNEQRIAIGVNRFVQTDATIHPVAKASAQSPRLQPVRDAEAFEPQATQEATT